jgi:hypothetical protein
VLQVEGFKRQPVVKYVGMSVERSGEHWLISLLRRYEENGDLEGRW